MNVIKTENMELVREIMMEPEIWDRASEDGMDQDKWFPGFHDLCVWLLCLEEEDVIGVILLHHDNTTTLKLHPYLRLAHRQKGREMINESYKWILANTPESINKLIVSIPENQRKVINFSKKVGFTKEGINRDSYRKDGKIWSQQNMGITRSEIQERVYG